MVKRKQNKSGDALINRLIALGLALCGKLGTMMMAMEQDTWGLGAVMRLSGTLVTLIFWWPYYLAGIVVRSLTGFDFASNWITQSVIFTIAVSFVGWYFVVVLFMGARDAKVVRSTVRQIGR